MALAPGASAQKPQPPPNSAAPESREARLCGLTDRCVRCGLCLPHCPTYGLSRNEGDSPRGRIALIQGLAADDLEPTPRLLEHVDTCLGCRACESVCPAGVAFGRIMDEGRALVRDRKPDFGMSPVARLFVRPRGLGLARRLFAMARRAGLVRLGKRLPGRLGNLAALLGPDARPYASKGRRTPAAGPEDVFLFTGCVQSVVDGQTLGDAQTVLEAAGYRVRVPAGQGCCGALPGHGGDPRWAAALATANRHAFGDGREPVVSLATGCSATLLEDPDAGFSGRIRPVEALLRPRLDRLNLGPLDGRALIHQPCTQRHTNGGFADTLALLRAIPGLQVEAMPENDRCCGAAGDHLVRHYDQAAALVAPKVRALQACGADFAVTSNIGCALHLGRATGHSPPVLHPVSLLARSLRAGAARPAARGHKNEQPSMAQ
jgi:glycolate oxidase iron-sulfur subunit